MINYATVQVSFSFLLYLKCKMSNDNDIIYRRKDTQKRNLKEKSRMRAHRNETELDCSINCGTYGFWKISA